MAEGLILGVDLYHLLGRPQYIMAGFFKQVSQVNKVEVHGIFMTTLKSHIVSFLSIFYHKDPYLLKQREQTLPLGGDVARFLHDYVR